MSTYTYQLTDMEFETDRPVGTIRSINDAYEWVHALDLNPNVTSFLWYKIERSANGEVVNLLGSNYKLHTGQYPSIVEAIYHNRKMFNDPIRTHLRAA
jgi:hypothetical protein